MFKSKRTNKPVILSELPNYPFQSVEDDEDLYFFEVEPKVSKTAMDEAVQLLNNREIPDNFSVDKQLTQFSQDFLKTNKMNLEKFKALDVFKHEEYEYCQAVLVSLIWYLAQTVTKGVKT